MEIARDAGSRDFSVKLLSAAREGTPPRGYLEHAGRRPWRGYREIPRRSPARLGDRHRRGWPRARDGDANVRPPTSEDVVVFEKRATERHSSEVAVGPCARGVRGSWSRREPDARKRARHHLDGHLAGCAGRDARVLRVEGVWRRVVVKTHVFHTFVLTWHLRESDFRARAKNEPSHVETAMKRQNGPPRAFAATLLRGRREWGRPHVHFTRHKTAHRALRTFPVGRARISPSARRGSS